MKFTKWCLIFLFTASTLATGPTRSSVDGLVTLNGISPLPDVTVGLEGLANGRHWQAKTNASGYYLFEDVRPGAYSMWADARGYGCILIPRVAAHQGERVRQDFSFVRGKAYGACEGSEKKE